jgi:hypothetical protein
MFRFIIVSLYLTVLTFFFGCQPQRPELLTVSGKVTLDGKNLEGARIAFTPKNQSTGEGGSGVTDAEGNYKLKAISSASFGVTAGEYLVTVSKLESKLTGGTEVDPETRKTTQTTRSVQILPKIYTVTKNTPFNAHVVKGEENIFNFDLTSKP